MSKRPQVQVYDCAQFDSLCTKQRKYTLDAGKLSEKLKSLERTQKLEAEAENIQVFCPLCPLPFEFGKQQECFKITIHHMKHMMDKYGWHCDANRDPITKQFIVPVIREGEEFATHPSSKLVVHNWCRALGPHQCQAHFCYDPFCGESLTIEGCNCESKPRRVKKSLRQALNPDADYTNIVVEESEPAKCEDPPHLILPESATVSAPELS
jgi:hypothetical protein